MSDRKRRDCPLSTGTSRNGRRNDTIDRIRRPLGTRVPSGIHSGSSYSVAPEFDTRSCLNACLYVLLDPPQSAVTDESELTSNIL